MARTYLPPLALRGGGQRAERGQRPEAWPCSVYRGVQKERGKRGNSSQTVCPRYQSLPAESHGLIRELRAGRSLVSSRSMGTATAHRSAPDLRDRTRGHIGKSLCVRSTASAHPSSAFTPSSFSLLSQPEQHITLRVFLGPISTQITQGRRPALPCVQRPPDTPKAQLACEPGMTPSLNANALS